MNYELIRRFLHCRGCQPRLCKEESYRLLRFSACFAVSSTEAENQDAANFTHRERVAGHIYVLRFEGFYCLFLEEDCMAGKTLLPSVEVSDSTCEVISRCYETC